MTVFIINVSVLLLIVLVVYWFWLSKPKSNAIEATNLIEIKIKDGVYQPAQITAKLGQPLTLRFIRTDPTPCTEVVIFNKLNISQPLQLNAPTNVLIPTTRMGEFEFTCQMGMYRGKVIIK